MSDGIAPFDDAIHNVAGVVLLVGAERLGGEGGNVYGLQHYVWVNTHQVHTGLMSLLRDPMKSALVTCSFSARSISTSTVDVACWWGGLGLESSQHSKFNEF